MTHCPSCGRHVEGREACPHCGAHLEGRISIRLVKICALLFTTLSLAVLWFVAIRTEVPKISIGQARATTNLAYVRVEGRCSRTPSYDPESDYLAFWISDGTGELYVTAYRAEARELLDQGRVPALGDWVEVAGTLRIREDFRSLTLNVPDQLKISRPEPVERSIGSITSEDRYRRVRVRGRVSEIYSPYDGLTLIELSDGHRTVPIVVEDDLIALSSESRDAELALTPGQSVAVTATVSLYEGKPQLVPASIADIVPLIEPLAEPLQEELPITSIGDLTAIDVGRLVTVRGLIGAVDHFSAGVKYRLDDDSGAIILLLWQEVYDALPNSEALAPGVQVEVTGRIEEYRGDLEIIPETDGVRVVE